MSYKQLFLLILTIWSAELFTRLLFDTLIHPQMEYMTYYLNADEEGTFKGGQGYMTKIGNRGWQLIDATPNPQDKDQMILFFQRRTLFSSGY